MQNHKHTEHVQQITHPSKPEIHRNSYYKVQTLLLRLFKMQDLFVHDSNLKNAPLLKYSTQKELDSKRKLDQNGMVGLEWKKRENLALEFFRIDS